MSEPQFTPAPWYVRDLTALTMRRLGWTGPSIDSILITNKTGPEIIRDEGEDCVIARIQFDHRPEELGESNLADANLIAAAPELYEAAEAAANAIELILNNWSLDEAETNFAASAYDRLIHASAKARGEQ